MKTNVMTSEEFKERIQIWYRLIKLKKKDASITCLEEIKGSVHELTKQDKLFYKLMQSRHHLLFNENERAYGILKEIRDDINNAEESIKFYYHYFLGIYFDRKYAYTSALKEYELAEALSGNFPDQVDEADYRYEMGTVYYHLDINSKSLFHLEKAYRIYKELPTFKEQLAHTEISLGLNYTDIRLYELAEEYIHSGLKHYIELKLDMYQNIAYHNLALLYKKQELYEAAIRYFNKVIESEPSFRLETLYYLSESLLLDENFDEAKVQLTDGLHLAIEDQDELYIHRFKVLLVQHFEKNQLEVTLTKALDYLLEHDKLHDIPKFASMLGDYYEGMLNFKEANHYNKIALAIMEKKN